MAPLRRQHGPGLVLVTQSKKHRAMAVLIRTKLSGLTLIYSGLFTQGFLKVFCLLKMPQGTSKHVQQPVRGEWQQ